MKKNIFSLVAVVVILIVAVALVLIIGGGKYSTPKRTLNTMIKSMEKGDIDAYLDVMTEDSQKLLIDAGVKNEDGEELKTQVEDFKKADFKLIDKDDNVATMKSDEEKTYLVFKKEETGWKLDLEATFQKMFEEATPEL